MSQTPRYDSSDRSELDGLREEHRDTLGKLIERDRDPARGAQVVLVEGDFDV